MSYKLIVNNDEIQHISGLNWKDNLEDCANILSFTSDEQFEVGSQFALMSDNNLVMQGVLTDFHQSKRSLFDYTGYDFGFYLKNNTIVKQFRNPINIRDAFIILCRDFRIPIGSIPQINATVVEMYKNESLSDVFKKLLNIAKTATLTDYYFTCASGQFEIKTYERKTNLSAKLSDFLSTDSESTINSPNISISMQELKNQVFVANNGDKLTKRHIEHNQPSINKYGLLQHVEEVDDNPKNNFVQIAQNKLDELKRLKTTINLSMLGDYSLCKGTVIPINNQILGLNGDYLVKSSNHTIEGTKENIEVSLQKYP